MPGSDRPWAHGFRISFTPLAGVLFTVPSRYWFAIGRRGYLALGGGPPRFPPDSACPAVLTQERHPTRPAVAYGTLTPSGGPFQRPSADWVVGARGLPAPPRPPSYPPTAPAAASAAVGVWAPPRSLAATKGILSLPPGTEMFQFPGCPPSEEGAGVSPPAGCPIRVPPDRRPPAPPRGVSSRGHALLRPAAPRHPPCARLCGHPPPGRSQTGPRVVPTSPCHQHTTHTCCCRTRRPTHRGCPRRAGRRGLLRRGARGRGASPPGRSRGGRPPRGWLSRCLSMLRRAAARHPARRPVEPRGLEPRTSAVQGRRSPG